MKIELNFDHVRQAAKGRAAAVFPAMLAVCFWLAPAARAGDQASTNTATSVNSNAPSQPAAAEKRQHATAEAAIATNASKVGPINSMDELDDRHKLAIGDRLSFRIIEDEDEPKELVVTVSGDIEVPYIGLYRVVGQTCQQIALKLKTELEKKYYYHATVILAVTDWARSQGKIYIYGPVRTPGPQEIPSDEVLTLSKAIMRAGGFGDYADKHKVEVRRQSDAPGGKDQVFTVDVGQILDKGKSGLDMPLKDLDMIVVPERLVRF